MTLDQDLTTMSFTQRVRTLWRNMKADTAPAGSPHEVGFAYQIPPHYVADMQKMLGFIELAGLQYANDVYHVASKLEELGLMTGAMKRGGAL